MAHSSISDWQPNSDDSGIPRVGRRGGIPPVGRGGRIFRKYTVAAIAVLMALTASAQIASSGLRNDVVFTEYSPLSSIGELMRRLCSPLKALRLNQDAERAGQTLRGQPISLAQERYSIYVPPPSSSGTYSLLVFVPPWPRAEVPRNWVAVLNRYNTILVTAGNSGNEAGIINRREPLALLAAYNTMAQYPVDPQHVYIGGFSGGARVALRLALGYPDVFHGALLNAGSDPIGTADVPLPPADLFQRFQESTRLVYTTGERDEENVVGDMNSRRSLDKWCVFDVVTHTAPRVGHELADASALSRSLAALLGPHQAPPGKFAECRAHIERELSAQLGEVQGAFARGEPNIAKALLDKVDNRYGGLAAPISVDLASR